MSGRVCFAVLPRNDNARAVTRVVSCWEFDQLALELSRDEIMQDVVDDFYYFYKNFGLSELEIENQVEEICNQDQVMTFEDPNAWLILAHTRDQVKAKIEELKAA